MEAPPACPGPIYSVGHSMQSQCTRSPRPAGPEPDRRLWCTTACNLSLILGELLDSGHRSTNVHSLARGPRDARGYPARDFAQRFLPRWADLFVSYDWEENFVDLQEAIHSGMRLIAEISRANRPEIDPEQVENLCLDKIGIWVDFLFIDQNSRRHSRRGQRDFPRAMKPPMSTSCLVTDGANPRLVLVRARVVSSPVGGGRRSAERLHRADPLGPFPRLELRQGDESR